MSLRNSEPELSLLQLVLILPADHLILGKKQMTGLCTSCVLTQLLRTYILSKHTFIHLSQRLIFKVFS